MAPLQDHLSKLSQKVNRWLKSYFNLNTEIITCKSMPGSKEVDFLRNNAFSLYDLYGHIPATAIGHPSNSGDLKSCLLFILNTF